MNKTIVSHIDQFTNQLLGKPVIKTFAVAIELQGIRSEWKVKAETLSQAESNLMTSLGVNSATFPDSKEIFK